MRPIPLLFDERFISVPFHYDFHHPVRFRLRRADTTRHFPGCWNWSRSTRTVTEPGLFLRSMTAPASFDKTTSVPSRMRAPLTGDPEVSRTEPEITNPTPRHGGWDADPPCFFAFDLLTCDGKDLRTERLLDRKHELRRLLARSPADSLLKYTEYIDACGKVLFQRVCELDLEGIVAKQKSAPYVTERQHSTWFKILNREYSQKDGREELFKRERHQEPVAGWHSCDLACASLEGVASMPERR